MRFELRQLQYAQALAEHASFSRAAEALGIAQPSLSRGIKDLRPGSAYRSSIAAVSATN